MIYFPAFVFWCVVRAGDGPFHCAFVVGVGNDEASSDAFAKLNGRSLAPPIANECSKGFSFLAVMSVFFWCVSGWGRRAHHIPVRFRPGAFLLLPVSWESETVRDPHFKTVR